MKQSKTHVMNTQNNTQGTENQALTADQVMQNIMDRGTNSTLNFTVKSNKIAGEERIKFNDDLDIKHFGIIMRQLADNIANNNMHDSIWIARAVSLLNDIARLEEKSINLSTERIHCKSKTAKDRLADEARNARAVAKDKKMELIRILTAEL